MKTSLDSKATNEQINAHRKVVEAYNAVEDILDEYVAPGREKALAITNLEQSLMWAGKSIYNG